MAEMSGGNPDFREDPIFEPMDLVISTLIHHLHETSRPAPNTTREFVVDAFLIRAFNIFKSCHLLLRTYHWEDAAILMRSLFELLLNLEEINRIPGESEQRAKKFLRFNELQRWLQDKAQIEYEIKRGVRRKEVLEQVKAIDEVVLSVFDEFRNGKRKSGWASSWANKSVYEMASRDNDSVRVMQYQVLYSMCSDIAHSGPFGAMTGVHYQPKPIEDWEENETKRTLLVGSLATIWLLEVTMLAIDRLPGWDVSVNIDISRHIKRLNGWQHDK